MFQEADAQITPQSPKPVRVILSHIGRSVEENPDPKYLFYEGFHKSSELYAQEILALHEDAEHQAREAGYLTLTEGTFDVAKAYEAGLRNVVSSFGGSLSSIQAGKLKAFTDRFQIKKVMIVFDRDEAGHIGAQKAQNLLETIGLQGQIFDWEAPLGKRKTIKIPDNIRDLADLNSKQILWLRQMRRL